MTGERARRIGCVLLFFLAAVWFCRAALLRGHVLSEAGGDEMRSYYPSMTYFAHWVKQGAIPLWNNLSLCGQPFGLHSAGGLFDLYHVFALILDQHSAYSLAVFLGYFLNGVFLYLFLRRRRYGHFASLVGGAVWMFGSSRGTESGFFFLPLSLLAADGFAADGRRRHLYFGGLTLSLALYALNSNPQYFLYGAALVFAYLSVRQWETGRRGALRLAWNTVLPFLLAAGIALAHYLRTFELVRLSNRGAFDVTQAMLPTHWPLAVFPNLYESHSTPELAYVFPVVLQKIFSFVPNLGGTLAPLSPPYAGLFPVAALLCASFVFRKDACARFFVIAAWATIGYLALHAVLYPHLIQRLPVLGGMYAVVRMTEVYLFCLAVLSAKLAQGLSDGGTEAREAWRRTFRSLTALVGGFVACLAGWRALIHVLREPISKIISANLNYRPDSVNITASGPLGFQNQRVEDFFAFFDRLASWSNPDLWIPVVLLAALGGLVRLGLSGVLRRRYFRPLLLLFVLLDLLSDTGFASRSAHPSEFRRHQRIADFLHRDRTLYRVALLEDSKTPYIRMFLSPHTNMTYGISTPYGWEQLFIARYARFLSWLTVRDSEATIFMHPTDKLDEDLADFINVKYVLTSVHNDTLDRTPGYSRVWQGDGYRLYENLDVLPRAFLVPEALFADDAEKAAALVLEHKGDLAGRVILEGAPIAGRRDTGSWNGSARFLLNEPDRILIHTTGSREGWLVLSDSYYPGWRASVDGAAAPIWRANYNFRAVLVPAGEHDVAFRYKPSSVVYGGALSAVSLVLMLLVMRGYAAEAGREMTPSG